MEVEGGDDDGSQEAHDEDTPGRRGDKITEDDDDEDAVDEGDESEAGTGQTRKNDADGDVERADTEAADGEEEEVDLAPQRSE